MHFSMYVLSPLWMLHVQTKNGEVSLCTIIKNAFYYVYLHVYVAASYSVNKNTCKERRRLYFYIRRGQQEQNGEGCISLKAFAQRF